MAVTISLTQTAIFQAMMTVLGTMGLVDANAAPCPIIRGQVNRVPEPKNNDFIVIWPILRERLDFNVDSWAFVSAPTTTQAEQRIKLTFQADVHGPNAADNATKLSTLWRDQFAVSAFQALGVAISPLYTDDPRQMPFENAEQATEERWVVDLVMQANITITTDMQFANQLLGTVLEVDQLR